MDSKEFSGRTTEEALLKAQQHFDLPLDRLEVEVLSAGSNGLFGLGAKKARVKATPRSQWAEDQLADMVSIVRGQDEAGPDTKPGPDAKPAPAAKPAQPPAQAQEAAPAAAPPPEARPAPAPEPEPRAQAKPEPEPMPSPERKASSGGNGDTEPAAEEPRPEDDPEVIERAREVVERLVKPLDPTSRVTINEEQPSIYVDVEGEEAGVLIGRRGQTLDALQYLAVRIVSHHCGRPVRITVDVSGYRQRRTDSLEELALKLAEKARNTGKTVSMGPMSSQERRVVHLALRGQDGVTTSSRGRGELKKVLIQPQA